MTGGCSQPFSKFRIVNQGAPNHVCCAGIELYGRVANPTELPANGAGTSLDAGSAMPPVVMGIAVTDASSASAGQQEVVAPAPPKGGAAPRPLIESVSVIAC